MNLERAKLILIIAFAGLNLFLAYHLFWPDFGRLTRIAVSDEEVNQLESLLNENNYFLETSLDRSMRTGAFITVSTSLNYQRSLLLRLLREGAQFSHSDQANFYRKDEITAIIHPTGLIRIVYTPPQQIVEDSTTADRRELRNQVEQYLRNEQFMPDGAVFDYLEQNDKGDLIFHYYQVLEEAPVFAGHFKVTLAGDRLKSMDIYWLTPLEREPAREMEVITAPEALTNFIHDVGPSREPQQITAVKLGYFSGEYDAEKWEIPPVWRIVLQNGKIYYINAFTGNLEQESVIPDQLP